MALSIRSGDRLELALVSADGASLPAADVYFAVTEDGLSSTVRAGENRGKRLAHDHVVRAYAGPLPLDGARAAVGAHATLSAQAGATAPHERVVVLRALADRVEPAMQLLKLVWAAWRAAAWELPATAPRLWRT